MEEEELDKIIATIENTNSKEKAFFGVYDLNEDGNEATIKANKYGLELFACELLKASRKANEVLDDPKKTLVIIDATEKWITGDIWLGYIEPKSEDRVDVKEKEFKTDWKDKAIKYGCFITFVIFLIIFIAGIVSVISWFS